MLENIFTSEENEKEYPTCLVEIEGSSVLEKIVDQTSEISNATHAFTFLETDIEKYHLEKIVKLLTPNSICTKVPVLSQGSACSGLLSASQLEQTAELLVISANELVNADLWEIIKEFRNRDLDAGTLTFRSVHPRYSYVRLDKDGLVIEVAQRKPISLFATAGIFWFAKTSDFVESTKNTIRKNAHVDGSYFLAPTFNELILKQKRIGMMELDPRNYVPLKSEYHINQSKENLFK